MGFFLKVPLGGAVEGVWGVWVGFGYVFVKKRKPQRASFLSNLFRVNKPSQPAQLSPQKKKPMSNPQSRTPPQTLLFLALSSSRRRSLRSASDLLFAPPPSSPPCLCSCPFLFRSPFRLSFSTSALPLLSSFFPLVLILFSRASPLTLFSLSNPSAFLLARFSSPSSTIHGLHSISLRKALFSAQAATSSFVVRMMAGEG